MLLLEFALRLSVWKIQILTRDLWISRSILQGETVIVTLSDSARETLNENRSLTRKGFIQSLKESYPRENSSLRLAPIRFQAKGQRRAKLALCIISRDSPSRSKVASTQSWFSEEWSLKVLPTYKRHLLLTLNKSLQSTSMKTLSWWLICILTVTRRRCWEQGCKQFCVNSQSMDPKLLVSLEEVSSARTACPWVIMPLSAHSLRKSYLPNVLSAEITAT